MTQQTPHQSWRSHLATADECDAWRQVTARWLRMADEEHVSDFARTGGGNAGQYGLGGSSKLSHGKGFPANSAGGGRQDATHSERWILAADAKRKAAVLAATRQRLRARTSPPAMPHATAAATVAALEASSPQSTTRRALSSSSSSPSLPSRADKQFRSLYSSTYGFEPESFKSSRALSVSKPGLQGKRAGTWHPPEHTLVRSGDPLGQDATWVAVQDAHAQQRRSVCKSHSGGHLRSHPHISKWMDREVVN